MARPKHLGPRVVNPNATALFHQYKKSAKNRNHLWEVPIEVFLELTKQDCYICGAPPAASYVHSYNRPHLAREPYIYNGIDRVINEASYVCGNLAACCKACNFGKKDMSVDEYLHHAARVVGYNGLIKEAKKHELENKTHTKKRRSASKAAKDPTDSV